MASGFGAVVGFDTATGYERWRFGLPAGALRDAGTKQCWHPPPPSIAAGRVVLGTCNGELLVLDARSGKLAWRHRPAALGSLPEMPLDTAPVVADGIIYVGGHFWSRFIGIGLGQPSELWRISGTGPNQTSLVGGLIVLRTGNKQVAIHRATGKVAWRSDLDTHHILARQNEVFLCSDVGVFVLDAATGQEKRRYRVGCTGQILVSDETLVAYTHSELSAFDMRQVRERWRLRLNNVRGLTSAGQLLYWASWTRAGIIDLSNGRRIAEVGIPTDEDPAVPILDQGRLLVTAGDEVLCYEDPPTP